MLDLPKVTEVNRFLPKEKLVRKLNLSPALRESLKDDVKRITIANELSPKSMNIANGEKVPAVFVIEAQLKQKEPDYKLIEALGKQIGQKIVFILQWEDTAQLAIYFGKLYCSDWMKHAALTLDISGADFDEVWDGIVGQIALDKVYMTEQSAANTSQLVKQDIPVEELLARQEQRKKLEREIAALERKVRAEKQPRRKLELAEKMKKLKRELERQI